MISNQFLFLFLSKNQFLIYAIKSIFMNEGHKESEATASVLPDLEIRRRLTIPFIHPAYTHHLFSTYKHFPSLPTDCRPHRPNFIPFSFTPFTLFLNQPTSFLSSYLQSFSWISIPTG